MKEPIFEYFEIIVNRLKNPLPKEERGEKHHIYPKSLGGWNLGCNIVKLTVKEHIRCHELLPEIFKDLGDELGYQKMLHAWHMLSHTRDGDELTTSDIANLREEFAKAVSKVHKGKPMPAESRKKISAYQKGKPKTDECRKKLSDSLMGHNVSEDTKRKQSIASKNRWAVMSDEQKRIIAEKKRITWAKKRK